jgi:hypothetical protein
MAGTTPQGREILRKLLFQAETACGSVEKAVTRLEAEFRTFQPLQPEFALLLSRLWGSGEAVFRQASPRGLAVLARIRAGRLCALADREGHQPSHHAGRRGSGRGAGHRRAWGARLLSLPPSSLAMPSLGMFGASGLPFSQTVTENQHR